MITRTYGKVKIDRWGAANLDQLEAGAGSRAAFRVWLGSGQSRRGRGPPPAAHSLLAGQRPAGLACGRRGGVPRRHPARRGGPRGAAGLILQSRFHVKCLIGSRRAAWVRLDGMVPGDMRDRPQRCAVFGLAVGVRVCRLSCSDPTPKPPQKRRSKARVGTALILPADCGRP